MMDNVEDQQQYQMRMNCLQVEGNPDFMAGSGLTYGYNKVDINDFNTVRYAHGAKLTEIPICQNEGV